MNSWRIDSKKKKKKCYLRVAIIHKFTEMIKRYCSRIAIVHMNSWRIDDKKILFENSHRSHEFVENR